MEGMSIVLTYPVYAYYKPQGSRLASFREQNTWLAFAPTFPFLYPGDLTNR
jgi:hypothetical protein